LETRPRYVHHVNPLGMSINYKSDL